jgi:formate/nitrite transporter FocA (FNT family)
LLPKKDYGAVEDCTEDVKDDWLIPVIVGSVLGGLVIVVIVAYVIGRRRKSEPRYETM